MHAQATAVTEDIYTPTMAFDVASIRESPPADSFIVSGRFESGTTFYHVTNFSMQNLLSMAYDVRWDQVVGLQWPRALYNIQAKADDATEARFMKLAPKQQQLEQQHMLQALLADRFQLKAHWETRDAMAYDLVVTKKGPQLSSGGSIVPTEQEKTDWKDHLPPIYQRGSSQSGFSLIAHQCSIEELISMLSGQFGHPVTDKTGLAGKYDFTLRYHGTHQTDRNPDDLDPIPTLDVALEDQIGLKLQKSTGPEKFLIIDHIEKPSSN